MRRLNLSSYLGVFENMEMLHAVNAINGLPTIALSQGIPRREVIGFEFAANRKHYSDERDRSH